MNENTYRNNEAAQAPAVMVGFLAGAVLGAGIALLLAPASGEETRRRLGDTAKRWREDAKDRVQQARETLSEIKEDAKTAFQTGRETFAQGRKQRSDSQDTSYQESGAQTRPL